MCIFLQLEAQEIGSLNRNRSAFQYATPVIKYDRHGYKPRERVLILTENAVYILDTLKTFKLKHRLPHKAIEELVVTGESDNLLIVRIPPELKKDKVSVFRILLNLKILNQYTNPSN